jgi:hypothetical protein
MKLSYNNFSPFVRIFIRYLIFFFKKKNRERERDSEKEFKHCNLKFVRDSLLASADVMAVKRRHGQELETCAICAIGTARAFCFLI